MTTTATRKAPSTTTGVYMKVKTDKLAGVIMGSGFTHREIAMKAKLKSSGTLSNLASGYRTTCTPETAKKISKALKVEQHKLFETVVS